jgi:hypothetical protein
MIEFRFQLTMPVLQVAALMKADSGKARDAERELLQYFIIAGLTHAIVQLKQALIDFGTLSDSVDDFSAWLVRMVQLQSTTDSIASSLQMAKAQKLKIKSLKKSWDAIRDDYAKYNVQVCIHIIIISNVIVDDKLNNSADQTAAGLVSIAALHTRR